MERKLTIGMAVFDDYNGMFFSIQALRLYHQKNAELHFIIIDNNPTSAQGEATKAFVESIDAKYIPYTEKQSSFVKYKVFDYAMTSLVMVMDCHVMLAEGSIDKLLDYYEKNPDTNNLFQGPLLYDQLLKDMVSTNFEPVWRGGMLGIWQTDPKGVDPAAEPFEIPMQGMGLLSCRKEAWIKIHPLISGFGGEEGYIHEKFRRKGDKTICLPFLRWLHRFGRPMGIPFKNIWEDRVRNYFIWHLELGLNTDQIVRHFSEDMKIFSVEKLNEMLANVKKEMGIQ